MAAEVIKALEKEEARLKKEVNEAPAEDLEGIESYLKEAGDKLPWGARFEEQEVQVVGPRGVVGDAAMGVFGASVRKSKGVVLHDFQFFDEERLRPLLEKQRGIKQTQATIADFDAGPIADQTPKNLIDRIEQYTLCLLADKTSTKCLAYMYW